MAKGAISSALINDVQFLVDRRKSEVADCVRHYLETERGSRRGLRITREEKELLWRGWRLLFAKRKQRVDQLENRSSELPEDLRDARE